MVTTMLCMYIKEKNQSSDVAMNGTIDELAANAVAASRLKPHLHEVAMHIVKDRINRSKRFAEVAFLALPQLQQLSECDNSEDEDVSDESDFGIHSKKKTLLEGLSSRILQTDSVPKDKGLLLQKLASTIYDREDILDMNDTGTLGNGESNAVSSAASAPIPPQIEDTETFRFSGRFRHALLNFLRNRPTTTNGEENQRSSIFEAFTHHLYGQQRVNNFHASEGERGMHSDVDAALNNDWIGLASANHQKVQLAAALRRTINETMSKIKSVPPPSITVCGFFAWLRQRYRDEPIHMRIDFHMRWLFPVLFVTVHILMVIVWMFQRLSLVGTLDGECYTVNDRR